MKSIFAAIFLLSFFILGFTQNSRADVSDGAMIETAITAPLMNWVEQHTGVRVPVLPTVIASHTRLWNVLRTQPHNHAGQPMSLFAGSTIILNDRTWDPADAVQVSLIVHEMVHYAQSFMPTRWACDDAREVQAYTLQNQWLAQSGHAPFATASWIQRVSSCPSSSTIALAENRE